MICSCENVATGSYGNEVVRAPPIPLRRNTPEGKAREASINTLIEGLKR